MSETEGMLAHFRLLWDELQRIGKEKVAILESPNLEDDRMVRFAIAGFIRITSQLNREGRREFDFVASPAKEVADF